MVHAKMTGEQVAALMIAQIEAGTAPWQQAWTAQRIRHVAQYNPTTGRPYRGYNQFALMAIAQERGYRDNRWLTFRQAQGVGAYVKAGEHGTPLVKWHVEEVERNLSAKEIATLNIPPGKTGVVATIGDMKIVRKANGNLVSVERRVTANTFNVFNAEQVEGLPPRQVAVVNEIDRDERADRMIASLGVNVVHKLDVIPGYLPAVDQVQMPMAAQFSGRDMYYQVLFHEVAHWTGHPSRLDREGITAPIVFGSPTYAREEIRAEMASFLLAAEMGMAFEPKSKEQTAAYLHHWLQSVKNDKNEIMRATRDVDRIGAFVLAHDPERAKEPEEQAPKLPEPVADALQMPAGADREAAVLDAVRATADREAHDAAKTEAFAKGISPSTTPRELADFFNARIEEGLDQQDKISGGRTWLTVPLAERQAARDAGAWVDPHNGRLYVPPGRHLEPFENWLSGRDGPAAGNTDEAAANRTYLWVPGSEYHEAKAAGAQWDRKAKRQYVDNEAALAKCRRWTVQPIIKEPREAFADACANAGMPLPEGHPIGDGKWHRVQADGDRPHEASGAYKLFLDGRPAGVIQNHRNGGKLKKWVAEVGQVSQATRERWQAEAAVNREQQAKVAVEAVEAAKVRFAQEWAALAPVGPDHPYLVRKNLTEVAPQLKQDDRGNLCLPIRLLDGDGSIVGMQKIAWCGFKWIREGSCKSGSVIVIARGGGPTLLVEGAATGYALARLAPAGHTVLACLDAGNIKAVTRTLADGGRKDILVGADNDWEKAQTINPKTGKHYENVGPNTAREVMAAVPGVGMFMPPTETMTIQVAGQEKRPKDWADIWVDESRALDEKQRLVAGLIEGATRLPAPRERGGRGRVKEAAGRDDGK